MSTVIQTYWRSAALAVGSVLFIVAFAGIPGVLAAGIGAANVFLFRKWVG